MTVFTLIALLSLMWTPLKMTMGAINGPIRQSQAIQPPPYNIPLSNIGVT
eukprot:COSAG05_NODE_21346_length_272_cov_1.104046_1_plen_49_part_10